MIKSLRQPLQNSRTFRHCFIHKMNWNCIGRVGWRLSGFSQFSTFVWPCCKRSLEKKTQQNLYRSCSQLCERLRPQSTTAQFSRSILRHQVSTDRPLLSLSPPREKHNGVCTNALIKTSTDNWTWRLTWHFVTGRFILPELSAVCEFISIWTSILAFVSERWSL